MTLFVPDVNVLIYAFRADSTDHEVHAQWLNTALLTERVGLADMILSGFVRIVTHPRIFTEPTPTSLAVAFTRHLVDSPRSEWLRQGSAAWESFENLAGTDAGVRGNLVPDAHIAALCVTNGATLATRDRGFARFPGLKRVEPGTDVARR
ncbi:toxin-antitoxin system PIN domain toxin [Microbacterium sp. W4I4]|uniref:TA system VapC family ribonuclease toxin n=1 Tax=Microbacterium sp. W4I4 TaxID=3042295 RepID=UPI002783CA33|nr:TA system VapC family ribonuclease toxin [Microbacterium sp. W4I4]MDQ0615261.1 toxin-antitoxin system PIN domain toxin [Microbacterium sp. W4I4]